MNNDDTHRPRVARHWTVRLLIAGTMLPGAAEAETPPRVGASTVGELSRDALSAAARRDVVQADKKVLRVQLNHGVRSAGVVTPQPAGVLSQPSRGIEPGETSEGAASAGVDVAQLQRVPLEAAVLHSDQSQTQIDTHAPSVTLRPGDLLVARGSGQPEALATSQHAGATSLELPYEVIFIDEQGTTRRCEVVAETAGGGMRLIGENLEFTTQIYVGLRDQDNWDRVYALPRPLRLLITANVDRVSPDLLSLERTDDFKPVELRAADPPAEVKVQVRALDQGLELSVPVFRPRATVDVNPRTIQGFGLESAQVNIRAEGLPNPNGRSVRLRTSSGRLQPAALTLDENGVAHAELRSAGFGPVSVEVSAFQLTPDHSEIEFAWPWRFVGFALFGGVLGSAIHWLRVSGPRRRVNWKPALAGVLTGLLAATASAVGINLLSIDLPSLGGESLALVIAALGAWRFPSESPAAKSDATGSG